jgi:Phage integrase family
MPARPVDRCQQPWNKGLLVGQKKPLEPKHVWSIRVRLEIAKSMRDLVIFNLAIDSKLRTCDLVKLRLDDVCSGTNVRRRTTIVQKKTGRPVQFEISDQSRNSVEAWLPTLRAIGSRYLFPTRIHASPHISTRQYARLVHRWVRSIGLESASYGTHSMRRTKAAQIYRKTGNLRAVQLVAIVDPPSPLHSERFNLTIRPFEPATQVSASMVRARPRPSCGPVGSGRDQRKARLVLPFRASRVFAGEIAGRDKA